MGYQTTVEQIVTKYVRWFFCYTFHDTEVIIIHSKGTIYIRQIYRHGAWELLFAFLQVTSLQYPQGSSSNMPTCSRVPHNSSQLPLPSQAMLKPNDSRHQNQGMMGHYDSDSEDESPSLTYYTDINMVLKEAHFELLRRQKITFPE